MADALFSCEFSVRDYECDMQGIVNNAVYQHYLEHARHEYLKSRGIDFAELVHQGINLVVVRVELDYKYPLKNGDHFTVNVYMERQSPLKVTFFQDIFRSSDNRFMLHGKITATALNKNGRPEMPECLNALFKNQVATPAIVI